MGAMLVFNVGVIIQLIGKIGLLCKLPSLLPFFNSGTLVVDPRLEDGGRALTGVGIGASSVMIPIYIAECSPPLIRGRLVGIFEIMLQTALVFGFWVNYGVERNISPDGDKQWHIPVAVQFIPAGMVLLTMPVFCVESPRWLFSKNKVEKGTKALCWVRNLPADHPYIVKEIAEIQASITHELEVSGGKRSTMQIFKEIAAPGVRWRVIMGCLLMLLQNLTGINAINYYSPVILRSIGFTGTSVGLLATGIYGLVKQMTTVIFMLFIVDRYGRRPALLVGAVGAMVAMYYLAGYSALSNSFAGSPPADAGSRTALAMIYLYAIFYGFSWNGIPWIFVSEVNNNKIRTLAMMCAVCTQWLAQFIVVYSLPYMMNSITYGTFIFFGTCTVIAFIFAYFFVPETKGVVLEDMDLLFGKDAPIFAKAAWKRYLEAKESGLNATVLYGGGGKLAAEEREDA